MKLPIREKGIAMAKMDENVKKLFDAVPSVVFATSTADGQPNACIVGMKKVIDDETVYLSDQFFKKTLENIRQNAKVAVVFWGDDGAYEIHGTARYVNAGPEFEAQATWVNAAFESIGAPIKTKGGCFVTVERVYTSSPGPTAGDQIA